MATLLVERDHCLDDVRAFIEACGVKLNGRQTPQLVELLTQYGLACLDLGKRYAHEADTLPIPSSVPAPARPTTQISGVHPTVAFDDSKTPPYGSRARKKRVP